MNPNETKSKVSARTLPSAMGLLSLLAVLLLSACGQNVKFTDMNSAVSAASSQLDTRDLRQSEEATLPALPPEGPKMADDEQPMDDPEQYTYLWKVEYIDHQEDCHSCNIRKCLIAVANSCNGTTFKKTMRCDVSTSSDDSFVYRCVKVPVVQD